MIRMSTAMMVLFWASLLILVYVYFGYPSLTWFLARAFGRDPARSAILPSVSIVIPARNEEVLIEAKLRNTLALDYPAEQLEIVVASDASTDRTNELVKPFIARGVKLVVMPWHLGKSAMISRVVPLLDGQVIVFSDVSSELEPTALRRLVENFADPKVGCVCGLYRLKGPQDLRAEGEGLYWRYETWIKRQESRLHSILGAHGAFYAIRRSLFHRLRESAINDDYLIPMRIVEQGFRAVYEPDAVAWELELASVEGEFARRRRIAAGNCQQIIELRGLLTLRHGWLAFSFLSHKVLRTLAPLFMITLGLSSPWLPWPWSLAMMSGQAVFYGSAFMGYLCYRRGRLVRGLSLPFYFCLGNLAMLMGVIKFLLSRRAPAWGRSR